MITFVGNRTAVLVHGEECAFDSLLFAVADSTSAVQTKTETKLNRVGRTILGWSNGFEETTPREYGRHTIASLRNAMYVDFR